MSHIPTPSSIEKAPMAAQASLQGVNHLLGSVPNMFRLISNSPQTLDGYLGLNGALSSGELDPATRERIALAVAQVNSCDYCLAAHNYLATQLAKLTDEEVTANRKGTSSDTKAAVAVEFAVKLTTARGQVSSEDLQGLLDAGYSHGQVIEIIGHVALNTFTNYINEALATDIDFPRVSPL